MQYPARIYVPPSRLLSAAALLLLIGVALASMIAVSL